MRKGDGHLLAVGDDTFINDGRFQAQRIASSDTWTLQIRSVQLGDAGDYECQVSSNEPKISRVVHLRTVGKISIMTGWTAFFTSPYVNIAWQKMNERKIVYCRSVSVTVSFSRCFCIFGLVNPEPVVNIKGAPDMYVKNGSPVTLHCQMSSFLISPTHVEWRLNGSLLAQVKNHQYHQKGMIKLSSNLSLAISIRENCSWALNFYVWSRHVC